MCTNNPFHWFLVHVLVFCKTFWRKFSIIFDHIFYIVMNIHHIHLQLFNSLPYRFICFLTKKNWRPPRLRAFGSGGRKRNTYEYACLLTRPDCRQTKKKFWLNEFSSFTARKSGNLISIIHEIFWRNLRNKRWHNPKFHLKIFENELLKTKIKILQERKNDTSLSL